MNRYRPTPSILLALLALVMASTGSAVAASFITSKQIQDGTIQTTDISKKARNALKGQRGASGPVGPVGPAGPKGADGAQGVKGDKGDRGPSNAVVKYVHGAVQWSTSPTDILSITLPAGNWVVNAGGTLNNNDVAIQAVSCVLDLGGTTIASVASARMGAQNGPDVYEAERMPLAMTGGGALPSGGTATITCTGTSPNGNVVEPSLTATQVETLTTG